MIVGLADQIANRLLGMCGGLHYNSDLKVDKKGRSYRFCMICGKRSLELDKKPEPKQTP